MNNKLEIKKNLFLVRLWVKFLFYFFLTLGSYVFLFFITDTTTFILSYERSYINAAAVDCTQYHTQLLKIPVRVN